MAFYYFTEQAEQDLVAITDFTLATWGSNQATRYLDELEVTAQVLAENPALGAVRDDLYIGLRSFPYQAHIIFYFIQVDGIVITRVLHSSVDIVRYF